MGNKRDGKIEVYFSEERRDDGIDREDKRGRIEEKNKELKEQALNIYTDGSVEGGPVKRRGSMCHT